MPGGKGVSRAGAAPALGRRGLVKNCRKMTKKGECRQYSFWMILENSCIIWKWEGAADEMHSQKKHERALGALEEKRRTAGPNWYRYDVRPEYVELPERGDCRTYGIQAAMRLAEGFVVLAAVHDVTPDRALAVRLAWRFTRCQLSPLHLWDAVADSLP